MSKTKDKKQKHKGWRFWLIFVATPIIVLACSLLVVYGLYIKNRVPGKKGLEKGLIYANLNRHTEAIGEFQRELTKNPDDADVYHHMGVSYLKLKEYDKATAAFGTALKIAPDFTESYVQLAIIKLRKAIEFREQGKHQSLVLEKLSEAEEICKEVINKDPNFIRAHMLIGEIHAAQGFNEDAIDDYKKALSLDKSLIDAHIALVKLFLRQEDIDTAEQHCNTALSDIDPDNYQILILLASIYDHREKYDESIAVLKKILNKKPEDVVAHTQLSILYLKTSKFDEAFSAIEKVFKYSSPTTLPPVAYFVKGSVLLQRKDYTNAIVQLTEVTKRLPKMTDGHYFLGLALTENKKIEQAKVEFQTAIRLAPEFVPAKLGLANLMIRGGQFKEAISLGKDILYLDPKNINAMQIVGTAHLKLGELEAAEEQFKYILELNPSLGDINMAYMSLEAGKLSKCIRQCKDIIKLNPESSKAYEILGIAYVRRKEFDKGIEPFLKAIAIDKHSTDTYINLANAYIMVGKNSEAIETLEKLITIRPDIVNARVILANLYKYEGNIDKTISTFEKVLEIDPSHIPGFALASLYLLRGVTDKAIELFNRALELDPENALLYSNAAIAFQQNENFGASIEYSKKSIDLKPEIASFNFVLANLYTSIGDVDSAKKLVNSIPLLNDDEKNEYTELIDLCQKDKAKGSQITLALNRAIVARQMGTFDMSVDECKKAADIFPDNQIPKIFLAGTYLTSGKSEEAINIYNEIIEDKPRFTSSYKGLGKAYLLSEKRNEAIAAYQNLIDIDNDSVSARLILANLLIKQGAIDKAVKLIDEATEMDPENVAARSMLGRVNLHGSKYKEAENEFLKTLDSEKGTFDGHFNLAKMKLANGDIDSCIEHCKAGLKIRPINVNLINILGVAYILKGLPDKATEEFNKIIDINADFIDAYINLAKINLRKKNRTAAEHLYKTALIINPESINAQLGLGNTYNAMGKHEEAIKQFNSIKENHPENEKVYISLANSYLAIGDNGKAKEIIEQAIDINPESNNVNYMQARIHINEENISSAINILKTLLQNYPKFANAYILGILYIDTGEYDKAISVYKQASNNFPDSALIWSNLAVAYLMKKEYEKAIDSVFKALEKKTSPTLQNLKEICAFLNKNSENQNDEKIRAKVKEAYHLSRAIAYFGNKWFKRCLAEYDEIIKISPTNKAIYYTKVDILSTIGKHDSAIETCKKIIELDPTSLEAYKKLANIYIRAGKMEDAEKQFTRVLEMAPNDANTHVKLGMMLQSNDQIKESIEYYKRAIELKPSAVAYNNLAWIYTYESGEGKGLEEAVRFAKKAKELSGNNAAIIDTLGWAYYLSDEYDKALIELENAVNAIPWNPTIRYHLGMTYYKKGMTRMALNQLEKAIEINAKFPEADEATKLIKELTATKSTK